jgi:hypothetical protein
LVQKHFCRASSTRQCARFEDIFAPFHSQALSPEAEESAALGWIDLVGIGQQRLIGFKNPMIFAGVAGAIFGPRDLP